MKEIFWDNTNIEELQDNCQVITTQVGAKQWLDECRDGKHPAPVIFLLDGSISLMYCDDEPPKRVR